MSKRIILVGPTASGKTFIRDKFREKGYKIDVSYTSREPREGEKDGIDYRFIGTPRFLEMTAGRLFYEWVTYNDNFYGTGLKEWNESDVFIMETDGIQHITPEDRKKSLIIFVNTTIDTRIKRMHERGWDNDKVYERILVDQKKFKDFKDYDIEIISDKNNLM